MLKSLSKLWASKEQTPPSNSPQFTKAASSLIHPPEVRAVISTKELDERWLWQDECAVEVVPEEQSQDPVFRDQFLYLSHRLKELRSPGVIPLLDFGVDEKRLTRVWPRRSYLSSAWSSQAVKPHQLVPLLEGLHALLKIGVHITSLSFQKVCHHEDALYVARLPFTVDKGFPGDEGVAFVVMNSALPWKDEGFNVKHQFFLTLGAFLTWKLTLSLPFEEPVFHSYRYEREPKRTPLLVQGELGTTIDRLLELDPTKNVQSLEEGLLKVRDDLMGEAATTASPQVD